MFNLCTNQWIFFSNFDDPNPDVNKLTRNFVDIVTGKDQDPARIAKLYKEMKNKDAKIMSEMSEKFPRML